MHFSVGICAYNEEKNIGGLLKKTLSQDLGKFKLDEIIVICSGCTDRTVSIVKRYKERDKRILLIEQREREGKSSAVNLFIETAKNKKLILLSADIMLEKDTIKHLLTSLAKEHVAMCGARILPVNDKETFMGHAVHMQWNLHHKINLLETEKPKVGEIVAFKKIFERIPPSSAVDEASIEPLIHGQGYKVVYVPEAVIYNSGPENINDFIKQRRRIYAGHVALKKKQSYSVCTYNGIKIFGLVIATLDYRPKYLMYTIGTVLLEIYARGLGLVDYHLKTKSHTVWEIPASTKKHLSSN